MGNDIFMRLFNVLGAFWCTWRLLDVFGGLSGALGGFLSLIAGKGHSVLVIFTGTFL